MSGIKIDIEKCKSCGFCVNFCPFKLISISDEVNKRGDKYAQFDNKSDKCTGCGICATMCPEIAIYEVTK